MVVPIKRVIRNKRLLSLLESQYISGTELGVELSETNISDSRFEVFNVYKRSRDGDEWIKTNYILDRERRSGRIRQYRLLGGVKFFQ